MRGWRRDTSRAQSLDAVASAYGRDGVAGCLVVAHLPPGARRVARRATSLSAATRAHSATVPEFELARPALQALIRNELSGLDAAQRERILEFVLSALAGDLRGPGAMTLARRLARLREGLREQLPRTIATDDDPYAVHIDSIYALDHESFWIRGWVHDDDHMLASLVAVSPEGARADLLGGAYRYERLDIQELYAAFERRRERAARLSCSCCSGRAESPAHGWIVELRTSTAWPWRSRRRRSNAGSSGCERTCWTT